MIMIMMMMMMMMMVVVSGGGDDDVCICVSKFEADRRSFMIAVNSVGTYLSPEDRLKLCPRLGRLYPFGQQLLAQAEDYEQIKAVSQYYTVSIY